MRPRRVVEVRSPVSGQLQELQTQVGDCFGQDDSIALINPSHLQQSLRDRANPREQKESLQQLLRDTEALTPRLKNHIVAVLDQQQKIVLQNLKESEIKAKLQQLELDRNQAQQLYLENLTKIGEIKVLLQELEGQGKMPEQPNLPGSVRHRTIKSQYTG